MKREMRRVKRSGRRKEMMRSKPGPTVSGLTRGCWREMSVREKCRL
jgi:hypothetical protein